MVASAVFITDLSGKSIISRNYRGDVPLTKAIETFAKYLADVEDESKKPVFYVDNNGDDLDPEDVGCTGPGGETFVYVQVSTKSTGAPFSRQCRQKEHACHGVLVSFSHPLSSIATCIFVL
jgi:hypothetical protein